MGPKKGKKAKGGNKDDWGEDNNIEEKLKDLMTSDVADANDQDFQAGKSKGNKNKKKAKVKGTKSKNLNLQEPFILCSKAASNE